MGKRKINDGRFIEELNSPIELKIITKAPGKWMLTDLETNQKYIGTTNKKIGKNWKLIDDE